MTGQPSARVAWRSEKVNADAGDFYRATARTVEDAWVRPRHDGYIAFQTEASAVLRRALLEDAGPVSTIDTLRAAWSRSLANTAEEQP